MLAAARELSAQYTRYGYRRIRIFLGRYGHKVSATRAYRPWTHAKLQVPLKRPRRRIATGRPRPLAPTGTNQVDGGIRFGRVIAVLTRLVSECGAQRHLRSENGPQFVSRALLEWIIEQGIGTALIDPCKPWQNGVTESFNGKFSDECLSMEWFRSRAEAKAVIETWRQHYNRVRTHSILNYLTPAEFAARGARPADRQATGRTAAVCGPDAFRPVAAPSLQGQSEAEMRVGDSSYSWSE